MVRHHKKAKSMSKKGLKVQSLSLLIFNCTSTEQNSTTDQSLGKKTKIKISNWKIILYFHSKLFIDQIFEENT